MTTNDEALQVAADHVFLCGVGDAAEQLCRANMTLGIAKIRHAERELGLEPCAMFIGAPDATVTRNRYRWRQGFGYGGQVSWHPELAVLDSKPNGCGMLVAAPHALPDEQHVRDVARRLHREPLQLDGVTLAYDLGESNHFVDVLRLEQQLAPTPRDAELPQQLVVIHSSGHEHRPSSPFGPGLYVDESEQLQRMASVVETPWGNLSLLRGADAAAYHRFCQRVQRFNQRRRELFGRALFGPLTPLCNATHQGMRAPGVFHLGAYWFEGTEQLFPLTLGPDQPVYLLRPRHNVSRRALELAGWRGRAERLGLTPKLRRADLLPHGGGYAYPQFSRLLRCGSRDGQGRFTMERADTGDAVELDQVRDQPFAYRGEEVLHRLTELELATPVARYRIQYVVKE